MHGNVGFTCSQAKDTVYQSGCRSAGFGRTIPPVPAVNTPTIDHVII